MAASSDRPASGDGYLNSLLSSTQQWSSRDRSTLRDEPSRDVDEITGKHNSINSTNFGGDLRGIGGSFATTAFIHDNNRFSLSETVDGTHTMGDPLQRYVDSKIHQAIRDQDWSKIIVHGNYERSDHSYVFDGEKKRKRFNWHRPTAIPLDDQTLQVSCFPGQDYVFHYACLVATYLSLHKRDPSIVQMQQPLDDQCMRLFKNSNLDRMGEVEVVIVGYVEKLAPNDDWETGTDGEDQLFAWQKDETVSGRSIAYLGCVVSFWGDISQQLVKALCEINRAKCVVYIGKTGSLRSGDEPNKVVATGSSSWIAENLSEWRNVFDGLLPGEDPALFSEQELGVLDVDGNHFAAGIHVSVASPLQESQRWLNNWRGKADWVDCEVGLMADECRRQGISYGYLHIVSDNVTRPYPYNLANERHVSVVENRAKLLSAIRIILSKFLGNFHPRNNPHLEDKTEPDDGTVTSSKETGDMPETEISSV